MTLIRKPLGTLDILPEEVIRRRYIENSVRKIFELFNYSEIRTPTFEKTELFKRGIGDDTDVVSKEMYSFHNSEFTLKPEMTAPVIRAYIDNSLYNCGGIQKLYYISNMFRHERPQAGRYREFTQFGAEAIGSNFFTVDAELIGLCVNILDYFGIKNVNIKINTIGTLSERSLYIEELKSYLSKYKNDLSETSRIRLEKNPLRILDTKNTKEKEILENAPVLYNYLQSETKHHFENVLNALEKLNIRYFIDYSLVRGFDYYTSTTFEIVSEELGAQNAILGGGRYDNLTEILGGKATPAIGFACGLERLMIVLNKNNFLFSDEDNLAVYISPIGKEAIDKSLNILFKLRQHYIKCDMDFLNRSLKSQLKEANKLNAHYVLIIGDEELLNGTVKIRDMKLNNETEVKIDDIINNPNSILK